MFWICRLSSTQPQPMKILVGLFDELLLEDHLLLVDLLGSKLGDDASEVAFERVPGNRMMPSRDAPKRSIAL